MRRILIIHNYYQQPGGEDVSTAAEIALLTSRGHEVRLFADDNKRIGGRNQLLIAVGTVWNIASAKRLRKVAEDFRPHVAHFHNTFPLISPAGYYVMRDLRIPVVQTLHNYRLLCSNGLLFRNGKPCEKCLRSRANVWGVLLGCYRDSPFASAAVSAMLSVHYALGTWENEVASYVALTEFAKAKYVEGGLPASRIYVKPNFVYPDPGRGPGGGGFALFAGRLSDEKGLRLLVDIWKALPCRYPLKIAGQGPLEGYLREAVAPMPWVQLVGSVPIDELLSMMRQAEFLVAPSLWYEGMPRTLVEAMAVGLPAVTSNLGSMSAMIEHGKTGLLCNPLQVRDWCDAVYSLVRNPELLATLRVGARDSYLGNYTDDRNYAVLCSIYDAAIDYARARYAA